jgi:hypothetical protein
MERPTLVERAYELAGSGEFEGLPDIVARLQAEGYVNVEAELDGWGIPERLQAIADQARAPRT